MGDVYFTTSSSSLDPIARSIYTMDRERAGKNRGEIQRHRETQERERSQERSPLPANTEVRNIAPGFDGDNLLVFPDQPWTPLAESWSRTLPDF